MCDPRSLGGGIKGLSKIVWKVRQTKMMYVMKFGVAFAQLRPTRIFERNIFDIISLQIIPLSHF